MSQNLSEKYLALIDQIVEKTLQGKIAATERVFIMLQRGIETGTGEIWERCLAQRIEATKLELDKKLKAKRILRALETIETQYQRWQKANQQAGVIDAAIKSILSTNSDQLFVVLVRLVDPNQKQPLSRDKLSQLAQELKGAIAQADQTNQEDSQQIVLGIISGLNSFTKLEDDLISWMYQSANNLGFAREKPSPWRVWAKKIDSPLAQQLLGALAEQRAIADLAPLTNQIELTGWVELLILLQFLQQGLVSWFDQQPYNAQFGKKLSYRTLLTFAGIWSELAQTFTVPSQFPEGCIQNVLQILRLFARRDDFPFYNGIFVSFSGDYLENTLDYLGEPLKQIPGTQEKARILTLLGYSQRILGQYTPALEFHQEALAIAREAGDKACEIANLNHISRNCVQQKNYQEAISYSQRALILARQGGYKLGETNALVNLGYSQVFSARQLDLPQSDNYNEAINYLQQGVDLAAKTEDLQSQSLGCNSLGIAYVILDQPTSAIAYLEKGAKLAQMAQDIYLQGLAYTYLAEAFYSLEDKEKTIKYGCLAMYLLHQINSLEWRKSAGLITIVKGQLGDNSFNNSLAKARSEIIALIGVDGYDYFPKIIAEYQSN